ncbi:hypothetical protein GGG16DRAFT_96341, partial [Schizophyllum commune]
MDGLSCVLLANLTVLVYDTIDTFPDQVNHVWAPPYSWGTFLYLLLRFFPFVNGIMAVQLAFSDSPSPLRCRTENRVVTCVIVIGILVSEGVLAMRTYALYNRSRWIRYVLGGIWMCTVVPALAITGVELASLEYHYRALPGCHLGHASPIIIGAYLLLMISETAILVLTIAMGIRHLRRIPSPTHGWIFRLYRDGVVFYLSIVLISLLNVLLPVISVNFANWLASPQHTVHSICSCRILMLILKQKQASRSRTHNGWGRTTSTAPTTALDTEDILSTMPTAWITTNDTDNFDKPPQGGEYARPYLAEHTLRGTHDAEAGGLRYAVYEREADGIELE